MKQKGKSRTGLWILVLLIPAAAGVAAYFAFSKPIDEPTAPAAPSRDHQGTDQVRVEQPGPSQDGPQVGQNQAEPSTASQAQRQPIQDRPVSPTGRQVQPGLGESPDRTPEGVSGGRLPAGEMGPAPEIEGLEDECAQIEQDVRDFFLYLDDKAYVRRLIGDKQAWAVFTQALAKLSAHPPVPAGEGLDPALMARNIYHLFRTLDDGEILLAKEVIQHESDTLELNLDIFYRWLTLGDRCPDPEGLRPSQEVFYRYAGFFLNTIGGRSYLFRRPSRLRLLISYYAILLVHHADREGRNTFGIDILPMAKQMRKDMSRYTDYHYLEYYLERLNAVEEYYQGRR